MVRITLLAVVFAATTSVLPTGCPTSQSSVVDVAPVERGSIDVSASAPTTGDVGETINLVAIAIPATDGGTLYHTWQQTGGPGVTLTNADQAIAAFVVPSIATDRTAIFAITVHDDAGDFGRAEVQIAITADPDYQPYAFGGGASSGTTATGPTAVIGADQRVAQGTSVTLDGSRSKGTALTYHWSQVSGTTVELTGADSSQATFTAPNYDANGVNDLVFALTLTDGANRTVTARTTIHLKNPNASDRLVKISTTMGDFVVQLNPEKAPISTANFLQYVDEGFYDGTIFHRIIPSFVVQGGGFLPGLTEKTPTHDPITNEASNGLSNARGTIAMARTNDPDSATSQFYVNLVDNTDLDKSDTSAGYAVFGTVIEGMDVIDLMGNVTTGTKSGFQDVPVQDIIVRSAVRQ